MALAPLLVALARSARRPGASPVRPFLLGVTTGTIYFGGTLYWLTDVMVTFGNLTQAVAVAVALLFIAYLSLFTALFTLGVALALRSFGPAALLMSPVVWVATEFARGRAFTGFPWVPLGNSQIDVVPVVQLASLVGIYGVSGLVALASAALAYAAVVPGRRRLIPAGVTLGVVAAVAGWGAARAASGDLLQAGTPVRVGLVQGNVAQEDKWNPALAPRILGRYVELSRQAAADGAALILWPESSTPFMFEEDPGGAGAIRLLARETGAAFLIGSDQMERGSPVRYFNSAFFLDGTGRVTGVYRKIRLVPFGEYVPLKDLFFFAAPIVDSVADFYPGEQVTVFGAPGGSLSTGICYEAVFPQHAREAVLRGSRLLSTITNDAWYGRSSAPWQHFDQARMRAVEQGRYLVRAANTGISGIVDPYGRVVARSGLFEDAVVIGGARFLDGLTLYARIGDAVPWASVTVSVLLVTAAWRPRVRAKAGAVGVPRRA